MLNFGNIEDEKFTWNYPLNIVTQSFAVGRNKQIKKQFWNRVEKLSMSFQKRISNSGIDNEIRICAASWIFKTVCNGADQDWSATGSEQSTR